MRLRTRLAALSFLAIGLLSPDLHADPPSPEGKSLVISLLGGRGPHWPFERRNKGNFLRTSQGVHAYLKE